MNMLMLAYLDPGSATLLYQVLLSFLGGLILSVRKVREKIWKFMTMWKR